MAKKISFILAIALSLIFIITLAEAMSCRNYGANNYQCNWKGNGDKAESCINFMSGAGCDYNFCCGKSSSIASGYAIIYETYSKDSSENKKTSFSKGEDVKVLVDIRMNSLPNQKVCIKMSINGPNSYSDSSNCKDIDPSVSRIYDAGYIYSNLATGTYKAYVSIAYYADGFQRDSYDFEGASFTVQDSSPSKEGTFCYEGDVYKSDRDGNSEKIEDCGDDSCEESPNFCYNGNVAKNKTCHDRGCSSSSCYSKQTTEAITVETCANGCENRTCKPQQQDICANVNCGSNAYCSAGSCSCNENFLNFDNDLGNGCELGIGDITRIVLNDTEFRELLHDVAKDEELCKIWFNVSNDECSKSAVTFSDDLFHTLGGGKAAMITSGSNILLNSPKAYQIILFSKDAVITLEDGTKAVFSPGIIADAEMATKGEDFLRTVSRYGPAVGSTIGFAGAFFRGLDKSNGTIISKEFALYAAGDMINFIPPVIISKIGEGVGNWIAVSLGIHGHEKIHDLFVRLANTDNIVDCTWNQNSKNFSYCVNRANQDVTEIVNHASKEYYEMFKTVLEIPGGFLTLLDVLAADSKPQLWFQLIGKGEVIPGETTTIIVKVKHIKSMFGADVTVNLKAISPDGAVEDLGSQKASFNYSEYGFTRELAFVWTAPAKAGSYKIQADAYSNGGTSGVIKVIPYNEDGEESGISAMSFDIKILEACPYACCSNNIGYYDKSCDSGFSCNQNKCCKQTQYGLYCKG
jgi:hypothetical protein